MAAEEVVVQHRDGRRFGVKATDPRATGEEDGWKIVAQADNTTTYVEPKPAKAKADTADAKEDKG